MAGTGRTPKARGQRRNRNTPARGEWQASPGWGWQHGDIPDPPDGLKDESLEVWRTWMRSWVAALWHPEDLPGLHVVIQLYDDHVRSSTAANATALRQWMDAYGLTLKGQQDRRWHRPSEADEPEPAPESKPTGTDSPYGHLRAVK